MAQKISVEVGNKQQLTESVYAVTFRLIDPTMLEFRAGQNMMLMVAPGINRTMSIASPPSQHGELLMLHDVSPMGPGSKWTLGLKEGDRATIMAPIGGSLAFLETPRKKVMVATGTGVAPFRAMVMDRLSREPSVPMTLYWGLRHEQDIYWKEVFDAVSSQHPAFTWQLVLSRPTDSWHGLTGHVTEHVLTREQNVTQNEWYLCGNKAMIDDVQAALRTRSVPKEQIRTELFF